MTRMPGSFRAVLVAAYCAISSTSASAQSRCGVAAPYNADLIFTAFLSSSDLDSQRMRAAQHLVQQSASAPHGALQDDKTCRALQKAVRKLVKQQWDKPKDDVKDEDDADETRRTAKTDPESVASYAYYRLGDYYGVAYYPPRHGIHLRGAGPVYLFRVSTMKYVAVLYQ